MREKILNLLEKNARIDIHDMAVMLGVAEHEVANEIADMEKRLRESRQYIGQPKERLEVEFSGES